MDQGNVQAFVSLFLGSGGARLELELADGSTVCGMPVEIDQIDGYVLQDGEKRVTAPLTEVTRMSLLRGDK